MEDRKVIADALQALEMFCAGVPVPGASVALALEAMEALDRLCPEVKRTDAQRVFEQWVQKTGRNSRTKFTGDRKRKVNARLKEGYTVEELCWAVDGCCMSPYHQGKNDTNTVWDDLELICRSAKNVDMFLQHAGHGRRAEASAGVDVDDVVYDLVFTQMSLIGAVEELAKHPPAVLQRWAKRAADWFEVSQEYLAQLVDGRRRC